MTRLPLVPGGDGGAVVVDHVVDVPGHRGAGGAGLERLDAGDGQGPGGAGLGLAVGVDHRHPAAQVRGGPAERLAVERLALHGDQPQPRQRVGRGQVVAVLAQHPQQRRRAQDLGHAVLLADLVEPGVVGEVHRALEADDRHPVGQAADDRLDGEGEPADVGRHPVHVVRFRVDLPQHVGPGAEEEAGHAVHDALGPGLGAAGEDQERGVVGLERHRGHALRDEPQRVGVGDLARLERQPAAGAVDHDRVLDRVRLGPGRPQRVQQRHQLAAPVGGVEHQHGLGPRGLAAGTAPRRARSRRTGSCRSRRSGCRRAPRRTPRPSWACRSRRRRPWSRPAGSAPRPAG